MNILEKNMISMLGELKEKYGVYEIKAEFEAEGSRMEELMRLKDVTSHVGLPLILKIGGAEAITDIYNGLLIGVHDIIAPMVETPFAVSKFLNAITTFVAEDNRSDLNFVINIETITAYENIDKILALPNIKLLNSITIGRGDLVNSMGLERDRVDDPNVFDICYDVAKKAKEIGLNVGIGGSVTEKSVDFIQKMVNDKILDKYETRKVVFKSDYINRKDAAIGINKALEFELEWLKSKRRYYSRVKSEDEKRIESLEKRLNK